MKKKITFEQSISSVLNLVVLGCILFAGVSFYEASIRTIKGSPWKPPLSQNIQKSVEAVAAVEKKLETRTVPSSEMQELASKLVSDMAVTNISMKPVPNSPIVQAEVKGMLQTSKLHRFMSSVSKTDKIAAITSLKISPRISYAPHSTDDVTDPLMDVQIVLNFVKGRQPL